MTVNKKPVIAPSIETHTCHGEGASHQQVSTRVRQREELN